MKKLINHMLRLVGRVTLKIWLSAAAVGLAAITFVFIMSQLYFNIYFIESALDRNMKTTISAAEATDGSMDDIVNRMIYTCVRTSDFRYMMQRVRSDGVVQDKLLNNDLQDHLKDLSVCHPLVNSAMLVSASGRVYYPVNRSLGTTEPGFTLGYDKSVIKGMTILPVQKSPFRNEGNVMPLAVPFTFIGGESLLYIADSVDKADAILYLFLDANALNTTLNLYNPSSITLLMNEAGQVLNYPADSREAQLAQLCGPEQIMADMVRGETTVRRGDWYTLSQQVGQYNLYLVHMLAYAELVAPRTEVGQSLLLVALVAIIGITLASLYISMYLSKPMQQLNRAVRAIENGEYNAGMVLKQKDEIGELSQSVDSMYWTIQAQMDQIRHERQAKDSMEMRLFAEQINPHFLYNTLEYINLEVYNHHTGNASMMIQALGDFLRIGLNFGREQIPLARELEHVQAYIAIMNHRFGKEIGFTTDIPEWLLNESVAKIILQPLVENSIRHGFMLEGSGAFIEIPTISIRAGVAEGMLTISVIDNGVGFDVENARRIMHEDPSLQKHVGLSNVYHRIRLYYGEGADIELQSIPYYKNTVSIRIPFRDAAERSKV